MANKFSRTELLLGKEAMTRLSNSKVAVFGIGGVGSYAVEALARAGIGNIVLVDDDLICPSNINRQVHATVKTVGQPKVQVMRERILDINPEARVEIHQTFFSRDCADQLVSPDIDYIVDAIDTVSSKLDLVIKASSQNIPIISCMGTGNKLDPGRLEIADIYETSVCPLARVMRRELRKRGVTSLRVVYSREEPRVSGESEVSNTEPVCMESEGASRVSTFRRPIPGSISFVPSSAGLLMASHVVRELIRH